MVNKLKLATKIARLRKTKGMSQEDLAAKAGVSRASIQRLEKGEANATSETLEALAVALGTDPLALVGTARSTEETNRQLEAGFDFLSKFVNMSQDFRHLVMALIDDDPQHLRLISPAFLKQLAQLLKDAASKPAR